VDVRCGVEDGADAVAAVHRDDAVAAWPGHRLDRPADLDDRASGDDRGDPGQGGLAGGSHERVDGRVDRADGEGGRRVPVVPVDEGGDIDVDDVALDERARIGDAVTGHLVH